MQADFSGVYPMLIPFYTADDRVDHAMWRPQVEAAVRHGCHGVGVMGLGTEVNKLSGAERREVVAATAEALGGRLPLSVTVGENTADGQIEFGRFASSCGASWLILQPPAVSDVAEIELLRFRHKLQDSAFRLRDLDPLADADVEADEMYQNAGEKRGSAPRPRRPAATTGEQAARPRDVRQRPAAGLRRRRPRQRPGQADGRGELGPQDAGAGGAAGDRADDPCEHGRMAGLQRPAEDAPAAVGGLPRRRRVGPRR